MDKLKMHSPDLSLQNAARIRDLFPSCVTEVIGQDGKVRLAIDFDQLRQELSGSIVEGQQERFHLNWPGKRAALLTANAPIAGTLRPCRDESVNFDTTKNIFIEGDNLEALKLLQESYLGKIHMIYIDPPYNTGNDFIYNDDFTENTNDFLKRSNQRDEKNNRLTVNMESNGRFHSDWLTTMYSRLKVAYNCLADDGLLAVSINDSEVFQLGKLLDELFGSNNKLACAPWLSEASGGKEKTGLRTGHEYLLIYFKSSSINVSQDERSTGDLNLKDKWGPYRKGRELMKWGGTSLREDRPKQFYELLTPHGEAVFPYRNDGKEGHWRWGKENELIKIAQKDTDFFHWEKRPFDIGVAVNDKAVRWVPYEKIRDLKKSVGWSTWLDKYGTNADGTRELKELFGFKVFDTPKPTQLVEWFLSLHTNDDCIVMDFFSGSSVTAHATMKLNAVDGGNRNFIMVQIPELCDEQSEAFKTGYKTISEISKERIRLAGKKIAGKDCHDNWNKDIGFRVLKIDSSSMADIYYSPDQTTQQQALLFTSHIKPDRTPEDLLFQVLLDWGVHFGPSLPIATETIAGKQVFFVDTNALAACFALDITETLITELAKRQPLRAVFRDDGFKDDAAKINAEQIFKQLSPNTDVKVI